MGDAGGSLARRPSTRTHARTYGRTRVLSGTVARILARACDAVEASKIVSRASGLDMQVFRVETIYLKTVWCWKILEFKCTLVVILVVHADIHRNPALLSARTRDGTGQTCKPTERHSMIDRPTSHNR